jgi:DNA-directed RNA polymerase specialized sigma24 family protein
LLREARAGSECAFGALVSEHLSGLALYCYLMLGDREAGRDALCETLVAAWRERELVEPRTDARTWLYRAAARVCIEAADGKPMSLGAEDRWTW